MKRLFALALPLALLAACSTTPTAPPKATVDYRPAALSAIPDWGRAQQLDSLTALRQSCKALARKPQWSDTCRDAAALDAADGDAVRRFFETRFTAWKIEDQARDTGLITGYYEPLLAGSRVKSARTPYPVYGVPADLVTLDVGAAERNAAQLVVRRAAGNKLAVVPGKSEPSAGEYRLVPADFKPDARTTRLRGRVAGDRVLPYYSRAELEAGQGLAGAPVLAWVEDATELFFLQVQGSGRIQLEDGSFLRVGYAEQNGHGYQSIGKVLIERGELTVADASMQGIQAWIKAHPERRQELFNQNPSYVFFRPLADTGSGPLGALGVPLTDGYSIAIDPRYVPLGAPVLLSTTWPLSSEPLVRLMHAQDTGGAIRGAVRADFFWGFGSEAGLYAGRMKQQGRLWILLPNGVRPHEVLPV
ncbi:membrane-bound lytic murein transglycosylase A [Crenobacter luteus]|uniref:murein transglycosylase A n=1 Tax=Crenobacter luteus TaxID=1452487 RepID=UPI00104E8A6B|nr:MltA domain-containing protein [Crenobacter luteus]TCP14918.1 membrane-bound lytic murein transglycosylase A [Crenobacter luteus]